MMTAAAAPTVAATLRHGADVLASAGIDSARLDAEVLLACAGGWRRAALLARLRDALPDGVGARFAALLARRARREPLAYLTGEKEFWSLSFAVTPDVLVPRPETELLVEAACAHLAARPSAWVCDVGTGSGCIAVAVAHTQPTVRVVALDTSAAALRVAAANALRHGVAARVHLVASDLFAALPETARFDVIASNPPYLDDGESGAAEIAWEPRGALWAGRDGLQVIERLVGAAPARLRPGGLLAVEIGAGQAAAALALAARAGFITARVRADLAGIPRLLLAERAA
jgi:release factor glutamine methyltransferase